MTDLLLPDYTAVGAFTKVHARDELAHDVDFPPDADNEVLMDALRELLIQRKNVPVSGRTSTGKTTFLKALSAETPHDKLVIIIEDTQELKVSFPDRLRLLSNE